MSYIVIYDNSKNDNYSNNNNNDNNNNNSNNNSYSCVNNKMLEHDWLLTALIYAFIDCFRSKLSDYKHLQSDRPNRTVEQSIKIKHFMPLANKL